MKEKLRDVGLVTLGSLIAAIGFNTMFVDNHIASGGVGGLAISLQALFGWNPANFVLIANIPLLAMSWFILGREVFFKTIYGSWIYPIFILWTEPLPTLTHQPLLAALFGGIIAGFGLGLVFYGKSSTGGTGIITQVLYKLTPLSLGTWMAIVDGVVVFLGVVAFRLDDVMYSIIALITITYTVNRMMIGFETYKNVFIISSKMEAIQDYITQTADRGVTSIPVIGGYSQQDRIMLMTTIPTIEFPTIQQKILQLDETAFIIVLPASQVMGRGFSLHKEYQSTDPDILLPM